MPRLSEFSKRKIRSDERRKLFLEIQKEHESRGEIPPTGDLFTRKYRKILEFTGLSLFGILLGELSVVVVYVIWNLFLHINLNP